MFLILRVILFHTQTYSDFIPDPPVVWMIYSCGDPIGIVSRETKAVILLKALIGFNTEGETENLFINITLLKN